MSDLTDFLLARIAEDEADATAARDDPPENWRLPHYAEPARVLAECEAKRRIVERVSAEGSEPNPPESLVLGDDVLDLLALPYSDHPDYREEWKP